MYVYYYRLYNIYLNVSIYLKHVLVYVHVFMCVGVHMYTCGDLRPTLSVILRNAITFFEIVTH